MAYSQAKYMEKVKCNMENVRWIIECILSFFHYPLPSNIKRMDYVLFQNRLWLLARGRDKLLPHLVKEKVLF